jgi:penicillin-binding protein-related factor A (putative recombinase)
MDGELRKSFRKYLKQVAWSSVESGMTEPGIPDVFGIYKGASFWVETKKIDSGWRPVVRPAQVAWHERHFRAGGKSFFAIRKLSDDMLYIVPGSAARDLKDDGIMAAKATSFSGGVSGWDWISILNLFSQ